MTDLISSLADQIVALINASPRSPTKADIETCLREQLPIGLWAPGLVGRCELVMKEDCQGEMPQSEAERRRQINALQSLWSSALEQPALYNREKIKALALRTGVCLGYASGYHHWEVDPFSTREPRPDEVANRCVCGATKPPSQTIMPLPYKDVSPSVMQLMAQVRDDVRNATAIPELERNSLHKALKPEPETLQSHWVAKALRAVGAAWRPCPGSTDGKHSWHAYDEHPTGAWCCPCGARKP